MAGEKGAASWLRLWVIARFRAEVGDLAEFIVLPAGCGYGPAARLFER
jgi:hypothetical protein